MQWPPRNGSHYHCAVWQQNNRIRIVAAPVVIKNSYTRHASNNKQTKRLNTIFKINNSIKKGKNLKIISSTVKKISNNDLQKYSQTNFLWKNIPMTILVCFYGAFKEIKLNKWIRFVTCYSLHVHKSVRTLKRNT